MKSKKQTKKKTNKKQQNFGSGRAAQNISNSERSNQVMRIENDEDFEDENEWTMDLDLDLWSQIKLMLLILLCKFVPILAFLLYVLAKCVLLVWILLLLLAKFVLIVFISLLLLLNVVFNLLILRPFSFLRDLWLLWPKTWRSGTKIDPLLMTEVWPHLFKCMDLETLKTCRLVCKSWNVEIVKTFYKNRFIQVPENFHIKFGFNKKGKNVELSKLKPFFSSVGQILALKFADPRDTHSFMRLGLPWEKVEIIISDIDQEEMEDEDNAQAFDELLKLAHQCKMIEFQVTLLAAGKNPCMKFFNLVLSAAQRRKKEGKLKDPIFLSGMDLRIESREDLFQIRRFAQSPMIQLEQVFFETFLDMVENPGIQLEVTAVFEQILEVNKNAMEQLYVTDVFGTITPQFKIPVLSQLEKFCFGSVQSKGQRPFKFHPQFQFHRNMPELTVLALHFRNDRRNDTYFWETVFENIEPAPSVEDLDLAAGRATFIPNRVFDIFTGIQNLQLNSEDSVDFAHVGQSCKELTHLTYNLANSKRGSKMFVSKLTGFPHHVIAKRLNSPQGLDVENIEKFRSNSSLLNLPGLEKLKLVGSTDRFALLESYLPLLEELVFDQIPNLEVDYEEKKEDGENEEGLIFRFWLVDVGTGQIRNLEFHIS